MLCAALTSLLESRQVSSVTSLAARQPVLSLLGCQLSHLTKIGFFFFFFLAVASNSIMTQTLQQG